MKSEGEIENTEIHCISKSSTPPAARWWGRSKEKFFILRHQQAIRIYWHT